MRRQVLDAKHLPPPKAPEELRCYTCDARAPHNALGWERRFVDGPVAIAKDFCPKHRKNQPKAMTTLGELLASKARR